MGEANGEDGAVTDERIKQAVEALDKDASRCDYKGNAWISVIPAE